MKKDIVRCFFIQIAQNTIKVRVPVQHITNYKVMESELQRLYDTFTFIKSFYHFGNNYIV
ncbi:hypothetical protein MTR_7g011465 [Medicago truncatula]|uniref:Uncharacterized protein n=1 Tax=Medicago truncatula TaxID=3880 RepID=Q2HT78_MEDTR|nr:hypothetical protein MtrDRAFT_AC150777g3v1 [Medicago truncatula]KEH21628.1 hypothetical protein MTR_7g011465 [Medicago truncatula]